MEFLFNDGVFYPVVSSVIFFILGVLLGRVKKTEPLYPNQVVAHIWETAKLKANALLDGDDATTDDFQEAQDLKAKVRAFCNEIYNIDPKHLK